MAVEVMRTIASVGSRIAGSGTESTRTSRLPWNVTAFIPPPLPGGGAVKSGRSGLPAARPRLELAQHRLQLGALRGERVGDPDRSVLLHRALHQPRVLQLAQPPREQPVRHPGDGFPQLAEAKRAVT